MLNSGFLEICDGNPLKLSRESFLSCVYLSPHSSSSSDHSTLKLYTKLYCNPSNDTFFNKNFKEHILMILNGLERLDLASRAK